jgi:hypothetical protein
MLLKVQILRNGLKLSHAVSSEYVRSAAGHITALETLPHDHLLLDSSPNTGPLISPWELDQFKICLNKSFRISKILTLLYQQYSNLLIFQRVMSGPRLGALSKNRWSEGTDGFLISRWLIQLLLSASYLGIFNHRLQMCRWNKNCRLKRRALWHEIGFYFLFQNIPIITAEKWTIKPENSFKDLAFRVLFEIVKFLVRL